jgi:AraC-like DNA-binding protein
MKLICSGISENINGCASHFHSVYEIVVVFKGICQTKINNSVYKMAKHSILITPPNFTHSNSSTKTFSDMFIQVESLPFTLKEPILINDYSGNILRIIQTINNLEIQGENSLISSLLYTLFALIQSILGSTFKNEITLSLKTIIEKNIANSGFSLAEASKSLGYNYDYLRRIYKSDTGITPTKYLLLIRIEQAKKLLENTNFQITTIALQCGFSDPYYFSRFFKEQTGVSPLKYRKDKK